MIILENATQSRATRRVGPVAFRCASCGVVRPTRTTGCSTGYGADAAGLLHCYACCAARDRADMVETGRATLYLTGVSKRGFLSGTARGDARVTNWPGSLSFKVAQLSYSPRGGGFGAERWDAWFHGPDGFMWHAVNRGDSQIARCKRTKERAR